MKPPGQVARGAKDSHGPELPFQANHKAVPWYARFRLLLPLPFPLARFSKAQLSKQSVISLERKPCVETCVAPQRQQRNTSNTCVLPPRGETSETALLTRMPEAASAGF